MCGGLARLYPYANGFGHRDRTLDLDPSVEPDYLQDARDPLPDTFKAMLCDPPYTEDDASKYSPGASLFPKPKQLVANMLRSLEHGQRCGIICYTVPSPPPGARFVACVGIVCGFSNRIRAYSVFEKGTA